jgi:uncharacterized protein
MKMRQVRCPPCYDSFVPEGAADGDPILIRTDEIEALRLVDYLGQNQEEAATSMGISRGTVWRCVDSGRKKLIAMVIEGRPLIIDGPEKVSSEDTS